ncbi:aldo/keto reductase [Paenibacillus sp. LMG 31456]|uniref:Aldo/keto reductase n=1 Tax=Paenibacillus foliorum TaxID=2654974 RepID=A0A972JZW7_9BACL|nr:aldo/keto reductase [Paenibacillus foliorum]NOU94026.1 aldo/keto reductase [Paenibacillus foliorum]
MVKHISECTVLNNGVKMPWLGLGVFETAEGEEIERVVATAIQAGYRSIDTASLYGNEEGVGNAIKKSGVLREHLFVTTKVWNTEQGYESTLAAFETSRKKLGLETIDLYMVHWPVKDQYKDTWRALEKLYKEGSVRAIGVSNFHIHHLKELMADCEVIPAVNQVEYHPRLTQVDLHNFCKQHHIQLEAWSPLMKGRLLDHPTLVELGSKHGKSSAQIILRWDIQKGVVTIPKSVNEERIQSNADIFDFELTQEDMAQLNALNLDERTGRNPDTFE